jgi:flagellar basal body-associated protein FliL
MPTNDPKHDTPAAPQYEPGGGKLIAIAVVLVVLALAGMAWSFLSRQNAPQDAPAIKGRFLPPSERKEAPPAATPPATAPAAAPTK